MRDDGRLLFMKEITMETYHILRQQLLARLVQLDHRLHTVESDRRRATNPLDADWEEQATIRQYDVLDHLAAEERQQVAAIRAALTRMAVGTYGICATCEEPIALRRLAALPYTAQCLECAAQAEQEARHRRRERIGRDRDV
jgi:RNA polymerase-binding transcription factor DksA